MDAMIITVFRLGGGNCTNMLSGVLSMLKRRFFCFLFGDIGYSFLAFDFTLVITQLFCTNSADLIGSARLLREEIGFVSNHEEEISYSRTVDHLLHVRVKKNQRPRCLRDL